MAVRYLLVTEEVTPPITPPRAHAVEQKTVKDTPPPVQKPGRSRGRGTWRAPQKTAPGVGTRSRTRQTDLEQLEAKETLDARAEWPPSPDTTKDIERGFREPRLRDVPRDAHKELPRNRTRLARSGREPVQGLTKASSGWSYDTTSGYLFHSSSSHCWWREGDLSPSKYGDAGANPQT